MYVFQSFRSRYPETDRRTGSLSREKGFIFTGSGSVSGTASWTEKISSFLSTFQLTSPGPKLTVCALFLVF
ncbi:hypothetical protein OPIT5_04945 [Opitutaceae bacterium TAV5]|nr:hypothetical protein OPIT5_04945 [Opitutaceae bacterium TAV5]